MLAIGGRIAYFYPRPPRGGRRPHHRGQRPREAISIHALREEGDALALDGREILHISIHALREEGDWHGSSSPARPANFYPRPPRGGRLLPDGWEVDDHYFYPRPPRGGRPTSVGCVTFWFLFLSTPSARRATRKANQLPYLLVISIHALREEGDLCRVFIRLFFFQFLSTPSARRATMTYTQGNTRQPDFYPRPPRGGRPRMSHVAAVCASISIHALREEGDTRPINRASSACDFYPRPPRGGRQQKQRQNLYFLINYTTFCTNLEEP